MCTLVIQILFVYQNQKKQWFKLLKITCTDMSWILPLHRPSSVLFVSGPKAKPNKSVLAEAAKSCMRR